MSKGGESTGHIWGVKESKTNEVLHFWLDAEGISRQSPSLIRWDGLCGKFMSPVVQDSLDFENANYVLICVHVTI